MGHREFGKLTKVSRLVYFGLSPFEQRAFKFYVSRGIPNLLRRMRRQVFLIAPGKHHLISVFSIPLLENSRETVRHMGKNM